MPHVLQWITPLCSGTSPTARSYVGAALEPSNGCHLRGRVGRFIALDNLCRTAGEAPHPLERRGCQPSLFAGWAFRSISHASGPSAPVQVPLSPPPALSPPPGVPAAAPARLPSSPAALPLQQSRPGRFEASNHIVADEDAGAGQGSNILPHRRQRRHVPSRAPWAARPRLDRRRSLHARQERCFPDMELLRRHWLPFAPAPAPSSSPPPS